MSFEDESEAGPQPARLTIALEGYEGPLDLMLDLARRNSLDLRAISILALADQYLAFIGAAQGIALDIAGDYLVMAAWLTYLKSRLLLPERKTDEPAAEALAEDLAARLAALERVRALGAWLGARQNAVLHSFPRGLAERVVAERRKAWDGSLHDLVLAYITRRAAGVKPAYTLHARSTLSIPEARAMLERLIGTAAQWCPLHVLVAAFTVEPEARRGAHAAGFAACLELAREGRFSIRQEAAFSPLMLKAAP